MLYQSDILFYKDKIKYNNGYKVNNIWLRFINSDIDSQNYILAYHLPKK